tara:strand:+ start:354 stop:794 length:441 start_codon:yes stop_codon:yes gene_type:complete
MDIISYSMRDYNLGKIYQITCDKGVYIGSTIMTLKRRLWFHKYGDICKSLDNCDNLIITLIEDYPCNSEKELNKREQYWIEQTNCINIRKAYQSKDNRIEYKKNNASIRYYKNRDKVSERSKFLRSWGGDKRFHNNLLSIDITLFN